MKADGTSYDASEYVPGSASLSELGEAAEGCRGCPLFINATQVVFGAGPPGSKLMLIGEQPGDQEDTVGRPFIGPAGKLLDRGLQEAGIERSEVFVTNAVKHLKWTPSPTGMRRLHAKPNRKEVKACQPWLLAEIKVVQPKILGCLGATAALSILGGDPKIGQLRGRVLDPVFMGAKVIVTGHPAQILRASAEDRTNLYKAFVEDLRAMKSANST